MGVSDFFIKHPVVAWVMAILVMLAGAFSFWRLPVSQFPEIALPQIVVSASWPGASAKTMEDTVTQIIEQQISGVDGLLYMEANSDSTGNANIAFTFEHGTDVDIAQVQIQNKVQLAMPMLPEQVQRLGVKVTKSSAGILMIMALISTDKADSGDLGDYLANHLQEPLSRVPGVGQVTTVTTQFAMRIWMDPLRMTHYKLNPEDIAEAVRQQNNQGIAGQTAAWPVVEKQEINVMLNGSSRLKTVEDFENIIIKSQTDGSILRLGELARIELAPEREDKVIRINGQPAASLIFGLAPGANALETARRIRSRLEDLSKFFPAGMSYIITYDTTPFVEISIHEVYRTLVEAIVLVCLVIYLFLQSLRATFIPVLAIPVVLLGVFAILAVAGYSINTLTMFGIVLAIGLLVDDAIVVVENVERLMSEKKLSAFNATVASMSEIGGALVGVALVIASIFTPMAFMSGSAGIIYRQFSITIVSAMLLSALVALTFTPALCATFLRSAKNPVKIFVLFNKYFESLTGLYARQVGWILKHQISVWVSYIAGIIAMTLLFLSLPTSFVPDEDQGAFYGMVQLPSTSSMERTEEVLAEIRNHILTNEKETVKNVLTVAGYSFFGASQNVGQLYIVLQDWDSRTSKESQVDAILARLREKFADTPQGRVVFFRPATIREMANSAGFEFELLDMGGKGHDALMAARDELIKNARARDDLFNVRSGGLDDVLQYDVNIDVESAMAHGLDKSVVDNSIAAYWGSTYINDFSDRGRTKRVYMQADAPFRMSREDFNKYRLRNASGEMTPVSIFAKVDESTGSPRLERYQGVSAVKILGEAAPGKSSGSAMSAMQELAANLPAGFGFSWTGISLQEQESGSSTLLLYAISLVAVFLCLTALYESWSIPFAVLLCMPCGLLGAVCAIWLADMPNGIYFQIGIIAIMGLSAKNSILIIVFAKELMSTGKSINVALGMAVRQRFRPIVMTSLAFVLGVTPLALNSGAGSGAQNLVGMTVVFGVLSATIFGLYLTPLFFMWINNLIRKFARVANNPE